MKALFLLSLGLSLLGCNSARPEPLVHNALDATVYVSLKSDAMTFTKEKLQYGMATSGRSFRFVKGKLTAIDPVWLELDIPAEGDTAEHKAWIRVSEVVSVVVAP